MFTNIVMNNYEHVVINTKDRGQYDLFKELLNLKDINQSVKLSNAFDINGFLCAVLTALVLAL